MSCRYREVATTESKHARTRCIQAPAATPANHSKSPFYRYDETVRANGIRVGTVPYRALKGRKGTHSNDGSLASQNYQWAVLPPRSRRSGPYDRKRRSTRFGPCDQQPPYRRITVPVGWCCSSYQASAMLRGAGFLWRSSLIPASSPLSIERVKTVRRYEVNHLLCP